MKVCIASKDRSSVITTHLFFKPKDVLIFVEPQEVKRYQTFLPDYSIVDIKKTNQGVCYARNFIIDNVREDKIIMADDDIYFFGIRNNEYRYTGITNLDEMAKDISEGLDLYLTHTIPFSVFSYFENKGSNNEKRFYVDEKISRGFYGINLKEVREKGIRFDTSLDAEDLDFSIQILLNNAHICTDYKYLIKTPVFIQGGHKSARKLDALSLDGIVRRQIQQITKKYGAEFINFVHDSEGYAHSCSINIGLLKKRKEIAKKNYNEYLANL